MAAQIMLHKYKAKNELQTKASLFQAAENQNSSLKPFATSKKLASPVISIECVSQELSDSLRARDKAQVQQYLTNKLNNTNSSKRKQADSPTLKNYSFCIKNQYEKLQDLHQLLNNNRSLRNKLIIDGATKNRLAKIRLFRVFNDAWKQQLLDNKKKRLCELFETRQDVEAARIHDISISPTNLQLVNSQQLISNVTNAADDKRAQILSQKQEMDEFKYFMVEQNSNITPEQLELIKQVEILLQSAPLNAEQLKQLEVLKKTMIQQGLVNLSNRLNQSQKLLLESAKNSPQLNSMSISNIEQNKYDQQFLNTPSKQYIIKNVIAENALGDAYSKNNLASSLIKYTPVVPVKQLSLAQQLMQKETNKITVSNNRHKQPQIIDQSMNTSHLEQQIEIVNINNEQIRSRSSKSAKQINNMYKSPDESYIFKNYVNSVPYTENQPNISIQKSIQIENVDIEDKIMETNFSNQLLYTNNANKWHNQSQTNNTQNDVTPINISSNFLGKSALIQEKTPKVNENGDLELEQTESIWKNKIEQEILTEKDKKEVRGAFKTPENNKQLKYKNESFKDNVELTTSCRMNSTKLVQIDSVESGIVQLERIETKKANNSIHHNNQKEIDAKNAESFRSKRSKEQFFEQSLNRQQVTVDDLIVGIQHHSNPKTEIKQQSSQRFSLNKPSKITNTSFQDNIEQKSPSKTQQKHTGIQHNAQHDQMNISNHGNDKQSQNIQLQIQFDNTELDNAEAYLFQQNEQQQQSLDILDDQMFNKIIKKEDSEIELDIKHNQSTSNIENQPNFRDQLQDRHQQLLNRSLHKKQMQLLNSQQDQQFINEFQRTKKNLLEKSQRQQKERVDLALDDKSIIQQRQINDKLLEKTLQRKQQREYEILDNNIQLQRTTKQVKPKKVDNQQNNQFSLEKSQKITIPQQTTSEDDSIRQRTKRDYLDDVIYKLSNHKTDNPLNITNQLSATSDRIQVVINQKKNEQADKRPNHAIYQEKSGRNQLLNNKMVPTQSINQQIRNQKQSYTESIINNFNKTSADENIQQIDNEQIIKKGKDGQKTLVIEKDVERQIKMPIQTSQPRVPQLTQNKIQQQDTLLNNIETAVPIEKSEYLLNKCNDEEVEVIESETIQLENRSKMKNQAILNKQQEKIEVILHRKEVNADRDQEDNIMQQQQQLLQSQKASLKNKQLEKNEEDMVIADQPIQLELQTDVKLSKRSQNVAANSEDKTSGNFSDQLSQLRPQSKPKPNYKMMNFIMSQETPKRDIQRRIDENNPEEDIEVICKTQEELQQNDVRCSYNNVLTESIELLDLQKSQKDEYADNKKVISRPTPQQLVSQLRPSPRQQIQPDAGFQVPDPIQSQQKPISGQELIDSLRPQPRKADE